MTGAVRRTAIWVTWERQPRNRSMAKGLGIPLFEIVSPHGRYRRYASCIRRTIALLWRCRPNIVVCQNPSMVLVSLLLLLRKMVDIKVVIDAHFGGIDAKYEKRAFQRVLDWCNRTADLVIVTNGNHASRIEHIGGRSFICPDPLPDLSRYVGVETERPKKVFLICSFDPDEPYVEVFKAATMLSGDGFRIFVSGNYRKGGVSPEEFPEVVFLGFVPDEQFYDHLFSSEIIIDLTDNDDCLVCGAYEALEAGKPLVLSKKDALQAYFPRGTVFTDNRAEDIATAIRAADNSKTQLAMESREWARVARQETNRRLEELGEIINEL
jgi:glycosyltransferase involved in cell wall biosynthesis